jgi:DNA polymerase-1
MNHPPLDQARAHLVNSVDDASEFMRWLSNKDLIGFDTETTGLDKEVDRPRLVQIGDAMDGWAIPFERWGGIVDEVVRRYTGEYVMHNAPYDRQMMLKDGINIPIHKIHDTRLMAHVLYSTGSLALKNLCQRFVDPRAAAAQSALDEAIGKHGGWDWETVPIDFEPYWGYGALDPVLTYRLYDVLNPMVKQESPLAYELEMKVIWVCEKMERKGVLVDREYTQKFADEVIEYKAAIEKWCRDNYGISPGSNDAVAQRLIEDGVPLYIYTAGGKPSVAKDALEPFMAHPLAGAVLGHRQATKIGSTYLDNYLRMSERDGRIHPSINSIGGTDKSMYESGGAKGVRTGRMSSANPNMQNVPTRTKEGAKIRNCFVPSDGGTWVKADFAQIEMRVLAHLSEDPALIKRFYSNEDFFLVTAQSMFNDSEMTKKDVRRQHVKNSMYAINYGAGIDKFAKTAKMYLPNGEPDITQASQFMYRLHQEYPGIKRLQKEIEQAGKNNARESGSAFVRSPITKRKHTADSGKEYALLNYMIQGTAGEILKMKMVECDAAGLSEFMTIPVHDEIDMDVPLNQLDDAIQTMKEIMNDDTLISVPIESEMSIGSRWGELVDLT